MGNVNELFKEATEESFFVPEKSDKKVTNKDFVRPVEGKYFGHIIEVDTRIVDVKDWKARLYNYTVRIHDDNAKNMYNTDIGPVKGDVYKGMKFRGNVWRFLEPKDGDDFKSNASGNKGYLMHCETLGIDCPTEKKVLNNKEVEVKLLPNLNTNDMIGKPVTAVVKLGRPWTDKQGNKKQYFDCKWIERWEGGKEIKVGGSDEEIPF